MAHPFLMKSCFLASSMLIKSLVRSYSNMVNLSSVATSSLLTSSGPVDSVKNVVVMSSKAFHVSQADFFPLVANAETVSHPVYA